MKISDEIKELSDKILAYQRAYYVDGKSLISDMEYDMLFDRLLKLEAENPSLASINSPTKRVGSDLTSDFPEIEHSVPVLSLDKAYSLETVLSWMDKSERRVNQDLSFVVEQKIDGVSIVLYYKDGQLYRAVTRGNGFVGNDVTENIKTISSVPLILDRKINLAVRGEVYLSKEDFEKIRESEPELDKQYANPRNLAAGSIRRNKSSETAKIPLKIFVYEGFFEENEELGEHIEILSELKRLGFYVNPNLGFFSSTKDDAEKRLRAAGLDGKCGDFSYLGSYIDEQIKNRANLSYEIDGLVVKVNEIEKRELFGYTEHHPRWAIAYKFESPQAVTKVESISVQVGRTGRITPVANLKAVKLGGSTVKRATLHNQQYIDELELSIGDEVSISKRGDVIPQVEEVVEKNGFGNKTYQIPLICPSCNSPLVNNGAHLFCNNYNCPSQEMLRISFFVARNQMDIETLGPKTIERLMELSLIKTIPDIYTCDYRLLEGEKGFGAQSIENIILSVEQSKKAPYSVVLTALGIPELGKKAVEVLINAGFDSVDKLIEAASKKDPSLFTDIDQIGPQTAQVIISAFSDPNLIEIIGRLKKVGLNFSQTRKENNLEQIFAGQVWCITGSFENFNPRGKALVEIENRGGRTTNTVTSRTTHLLMGSGGGKKATEAEKYGVEIVSEPEFLTLIGAPVEKNTEEGELFLF